MKMSKDQTNQLWHAVIDNNYTSFMRVNTRLLNTPAALKHIPIRIYIPSTPPDGPDPAASTSASTATAGSFKVVQSLVAAASPDRKPKLLGQALKDMMPVLFPSSRDPVLAGVVLHGAVAPFAAPLSDLMREAAYPDGWLCFVVVI